VVDMQRIWVVGNGKGEDGEARVSLRQNDFGDLTLVLGPLGALGQTGSLGSDEREVDLDVARALAQALLEACEVAAALQEP
jgi:hypothetical protein